MAYRSSTTIGVSSHLVALAMVCSASMLLACFHQTWQLGVVYSANLESAASRKNAFAFELPSCQPVSAWASDAIPNLARLSWAARRHGRSCAMSKTNRTPQFVQGVLGDNQPPSTHSGCPHARTNSLDLETNLTRAEMPPSGLLLRGRRLLRWDS